MLSSTSLDMNRPMVKPSYGRMAKRIDRSKSSYIKIINNIFDEMKYLVNETENVVIDLAEFGKF